MYCLDVLVEFIYRYGPPPGVLTLILAVVAAVSAAPIAADWLKGSWWKHSVLFLILGVIAGLEIMIINHADKVSEERIAALNGQVTAAVNNTTQIQSDLSGFIRSAKIASQAQTQTLAHHKGSDELMQLKGRAANMSADIFNFLLQRSEMFTGNLMFSQTHPSNAQQSMAIKVPYDDETVLGFQKQFGGSAIEITGELEKAGLKDDLLKTMVEQPHNMIAVRIIANHLAALAEQITPEGIKPLGRMLMP
jgi:hypothetical protein